MQGTGIVGVGVYLVMRQYYEVLGHIGSTSCKSAVNFPQHFICRLHQSLFSIKMLLQVPTDRLKTMCI